MVRGHEKTSTSQAGCKRGASQETPTVSSLVAAMSVEELKSFSQVPTNMRFKVEDGTVSPTIGGANNVVYFTRNQFAIRLLFPIPSSVK